MIKKGNTFVISSLTNEKIKTINSLSQRKYRKKLNLFVAEGLRICREAIDNGWNIKYLLCDKDNLDDEIGYRFLEEFWKLGYGAEVCVGLITYCKKLKMDKIIGYVVDENIASSKILDAILSISLA